jgi:hypothetical protein
MENNELYDVKFLIKLRLFLLTYDEKLKHEIQSVTDKSSIFFHQYNC